jgi:hypothetical protein
MRLSCQIADPQVLDRALNLPNEDLRALKKQWAPRIRMKLFATVKHKKDAHVSGDPGNGLLPHYYRV